MRLIRRGLFDLKCINQCLVWEKFRVILGGRWKVIVVYSHDVEYFDGTFLWCFNYLFLDLLFDIFKSLSILISKVSREINKERFIYDKTKNQKRFKTYNC